MYFKYFKDAKKHAEKNYKNYSIKSHDEWRPLFWLKNADKQQYKEFNGIQYSDCYEVYGLKRTGCFGCPFGSAFEEELKIIEQYEPNLFLAANNIFGKSYEYMRKYREYKEERLYEFV